MNAVIHFENHINVTKRFQELHLKPRLAKNALLNSTALLFQDYVDRVCPGAPILPPGRVASEAFTTWTHLGPTRDKTVCILDLDPSSATQPDSSYGLCVLLAIAQQFGLPIGEFLEARTYLCVLLTLYPAGLSEDDGVARLPSPRCDLSGLSKLWPDTSRIQSSGSWRVEPSDIANGIAALDQPGPRIVLANSSKDDGWLAELIANWLL